MLLILENCSCTITSRFGLVGKKTDVKLLSICIFHQEHLWIDFVLYLRKSKNVLLQNHDGLRILLIGDRIVKSFSLLATSDVSALHIFWSVHFYHLRSGTMFPRAFSHWYPIELSCTSWLMILRFVEVQRVLFFLFGRSPT